MATTNGNISVGATLNEAAIKAMHTEVKDNLAEQRTRANDRTLTFAERKKAQVNVINLQDVQTNLKDLNEQRGKIKPNVDGSNKQGEFKVK